MLEMQLSSRDISACYLGMWDSLPLLAKSIGQYRKVDWLDNTHVTKIVLIRGSVCVTRSFEI